MANEESSVRESLQASANAADAATKIAASISETSLSVTPDMVKSEEARQALFRLQHQQHAELVEQVHKTSEQRDKDRDKRTDLVIGRLEGLEGRLNSDILEVEDWLQYLQNVAAVMVDHLVVTRLSEDQLAIVQAYPNPQARPRPSES